MSNYNELQKKASQLGIKAVGVKAEELERLIAEAEESREDSQNTKPSSKYNTAIVFDGSREVRRYELEIHGEQFANLANEFAISRKYDVVLRMAEPRISCPACGHKFDM